MPGGRTGSPGIAQYHLAATSGSDRRGPYHRDVRADLRSFFERATVVELLLAFVFATTAVGFISAVVTGLLVTPLQQSAHDYSASFSDLAASIDGRVFAFANVLTTGVVLILVTFGATRLLRASDDALWDPSATRTCPHCLSEIPAEAPVCSYCTRDVPAPEVSASDDSVPLDAD